MSQSNYEKYAVIKQQELLHKERNLQQAISCLRDRRKFASLQSIDSAIDFVADLYDFFSDKMETGDAPEIERVGRYPDMYVTVDNGIVIDCVGGKQIRLIIQVD